MFVFFLMDGWFSVQHDSRPGLISTAILIGKHSNTNLIIKYLWLLFVHALSLSVFDVGVTVYPRLLSRHIHGTFVQPGGAVEQITQRQLLVSFRSSGSVLQVWMSFFFVPFNSSSPILDNKDTVKLKVNILLRYSPHETTMETVIALKSSIDNRLLQLLVRSL